MRETNFIKQNKGKWKDFEQMLKSKQKNPEKLSKLFIQITDDLSYSRTFYKNRSVRVYLNNLAQQIFYSIYKNKKAEKGSLFSFWTDELPQLMYLARRELLLSASVFILAILIGAFSSVMNPEFPRVILGDEYVNQTLLNIENNDPMAVYKQMNEVDMSFRITYNNIRVSVISFLSGLFAGLGTIGVLIGNGIMVGSFQYFFYEQGVFWESFLTIWIHGTLEISTIILSGCAGLVLGRGLVFPGTYSRLQSLQKYGLRALKIMIGIVPLVIMAGFIEGFVTRYTDAPDVLRLGIILASLSFVLLYFVWYPYQKFKDGFEKPIKDTRIPPTKNLDIKYNDIKSSAEIFTETFQFYGRHFSKIFQSGLLLSALFALTLVFQYRWNLGSRIIFLSANDFFEWIGYAHFMNLGQFFNYNSMPVLVLVNTLVFGTVVYLSGYYFIKASTGRQKFNFGFHLVGWLGAIGIWGIFNGVLWNSSNFLVIILAMLLFPLLMLWLIVMLKESKNPFNAFSRTFSMAGGRFGTIYGIFAIMLLISFMFSYIFSSPILWVMMDFVSWNFSLESNELAAVLSGILAFIFALFFCLAFPLFMISTGLLYVSLKEIKEANTLKEKIAMIGVRKKAYGLEQEK